VEHLGFGVSVASRTDSHSCLLCLIEDWSCLLCLI